MWTGVISMWSVLILELQLLSSITLAIVSIRRDASRFPVPLRTVIRADGRAGGVDGFRRPSRGPSSGPCGKSLGVRSRRERALAAVGWRRRSNVAARQIVILIRPPSRALPAFAPTPLERPWARRQQCVTLAVALAQSWSVALQRPAQTPPQFVGGNNPLSRERRNAAAAGVTRPAGGRGSS